MIDFMSQFQSPYRGKLSNAFEDGTFRRMWENARSEILRIENPVEYEVLSQQQVGVGVIRKPKPRRSFVIGSNPFLKLAHPVQAHLGNPAVDSWLPLTRDVAVTFCSPERDKPVAQRDRHIESMNRIAFDQSSVIAGCSRELIESLVSVDISGDVAKFNRTRRSAVRFGMFFTGVSLQTQPFDPRRGELGPKNWTTS